MGRLPGLLLLLLAIGLGGCRFHAAGPEPDALGEAPASGGEPPIDPKLASMLAAGGLARMQGRILSPEHDNALLWMRRAMQYAPGEPAVERERRQLLRDGVREAVRLGRAAEYQRAERLLTKLQGLGLGGPAMRNARERLSSMASQRVVRLRPPAQLLDGRNPALADWLRAQLEPYARYPGWIEIEAGSDADAIWYYRQLRLALPHQTWRAQLRNGDATGFRLHYRIR